MWTRKKRLRKVYDFSTPILISTASSRCLRPTTPAPSTRTTTTSRSSRCGGRAPVGKTTTRSWSAGWRRCAAAAWPRRRSPGASQRSAVSSGIRCCSARATTIPRQRFSSPASGPAAHALTAEAEQLIDAANGTTPRDARPGARRADVRRRAPPSRTTTSTTTRSTSTGSSARLGRARRSASSRSAGPRSMRCAATSQWDGPTCDCRNHQELFLNARGGPLTRAGAFLILRRLAEAGLRPQRVHPPPLLGH